MTRGLVLTADDLGREPGTDEEIAALIREGAVTATTLIPVSPGAAAAAARARDAGMEPRLHVTLTSERGVPRWRPLTPLAGLVDADGALPDDPAVLARRGAEAAGADVVAELDAQLAWMRARGMAPAAADSHAGTLYGLHGWSWLETALRWCARHGLAFRLPRDPAPYMGSSLPPALAAAHARAVALADELGVALPATIATNRRTVAELGSYEALRADYLARLAALPEGVSELFLHPSRDGAVRGPDGVVRVWEARLLRDERWRAALAAEGIELRAGWWS